MIGVNDISLRVPSHGDIHCGAQVAIPERHTARRRGDPAPAAPRSGERSSPTRPQIASITSTEQRHQHRAATMDAPRKHRRAIAVAVAILAVAAAATAAALLPVGAALAAFAGWGRGAGAAGVLGFAAAQIACTLLLVPAWPLRVAA